MNRRDLFESVAGVAADTGVELKASTYEEPTSKPVLAVFEYPSMMSHDVVARITHAWKDLPGGTAFEGVKPIVLMDGLKLALLDKDGHVLNRTLEEPGPIGVTHLRSAE